MLIISLSTIPTRFEALGAALAGLLAQRADVAAINVYIPERYRRFPDWDGQLPAVPDGVTICRCPVDYGPATKVLAAADTYRGQDVDILFCDDDRVYHPGWAARFLRAKRRYPGAVLAGFGRDAHTFAPTQGVSPRQPRAVRRWRITDAEFQARYLWRQALARRWDVPEPERRIYMRSGYTDVFEGFGGVLARPEHFDPVAYDIPPVLWAVDDVWLSGMLERRDIPIVLLSNFYEPALTQAHYSDALYQAEIDGHDRDAANRKAVEYMQQTYGIWR